MKIAFSALVTIVVLLSLGSCKKAIRDEQVSAQKLSNVKVPESFKWETSRDVEFKVSVKDAAYSEANYVVAIYTLDGKLLSKGAATTSQPFQSKVYLPGTVQEVYVIKTNPDNSNESRKVEVKNSGVDVAFSEVEVKAVTKNASLALGESGPDCGSGCTNSATIATDGQVIDAYPNQTICVSGTNKSFKINLKQRGPLTLRICGNGLTFRDLSVPYDGSSKVSLIITREAVVHLENLSFNNDYFSYNTVDNYGTVTVKDCDFRYFNNYGAVTFDQLTNVPFCTNAGTMVVNGNLAIGNDRRTSFSNSGTLAVNGNLNLNGLSQFGNVFTNNCKVIVSGNCLLSGYYNKLENNGYIKVGAETRATDYSTFSIGTASMLSSKDIYLNTQCTGAAATGSGAIFKVSERTTIDYSAKLSGAIKICDANGVESNVGTFTNGAGIGCNVNIPVSACNAEGSGTMAAVDSDGDGISDQLDDFPNDASKAFVNYYPTSGANAGATVLFEDMWPKKGDYDMNDVVLSYNLRVITNAQNKVTAVDGTYSLRARGGIYQNGFGIEFPINRPSVTDVTGGTLEEGQSKAVIILFDDMHQQLSSMNTNMSDPVAAAKAFPISFKITDGPLLSQFGVSEFNPFIWNKSKGRGYEIHLPGKTPTSLANVALFGTEDDGSVVSSGRYYVSKDGFPWAISIPVKNFAYPVEGKDIGTAYLKLSAWVSSGGAGYTDWYSNQADGYINQGNIFLK